ncbi:hypothetical protein Tco_1506610 [Tanacetum coccineum]
MVVNHLFLYSVNCRRITSLGPRNMIDGSDLTNYGFATHGFVGTAFDDNHRKRVCMWPWEGNVETGVGSLNGLFGTVYHRLAKQPPWPSSRGKAINESAASKKEIDVPPGIREVKAMADMHQRKAGTAKHSDNGGWLECPHPSIFFILGIFPLYVAEEDVEVSEEKTHDIDTSQSLQKVEQHLQTLCFSAHRSL